MLGQFSFQSSRKQAAAADIGRALSRSSTTSTDADGVGGKLATTAVADDDSIGATSAAAAPTTPIRRTPSVSFAPVPTSDTSAEREEDGNSTATTTESTSTEEPELSQVPFASIGASFDGNSLQVGAPSPLAL